ncbi:FkbM family methyltransferase [Paradesertivirga mongoliensis]|uniref:FkbM family methyltransferase n=1 Tax=Paradesertivirga mongoliensis TaxID=2100740 RepID=A0ABW4ZHM6_9SPHI|nr:FkbM family methyltransferase [Pedobacter mongoliensis]
MIINLLRKIKFRWTQYRHWDSRIRDVMSCPDNDNIQRVAQAGKIIDNHQIMHNGQKIILGSYYGSGITDMLKRNKGVHEPQEEFVFSKVINSLTDSPVMIELGSYWAFYSMWLLQQRPAARVYLFEPDEHNLNYGIENFKLNHLTGDFNRAYISDMVDIASIPNTLNLPYIFEDKNLDFVDILHSDIQGNELSLLKGAKDLLREERIGYLFISTHDNEIHNACINFINQFNYNILCEADLNRTFSYDGLIVAKLAKYAGVENIEISKKLS